MAVGSAEEGFSRCCREKGAVSLLCGPGAGAGPSWPRAGVGGSPVLPCWKEPQHRGLRRVTQRQERSPTEGSHLTLCDLKHACREAEQSQSPRSLLHKRPLGAYCPEEDPVQDKWPKWINGYLNGYLNGFLSKWIKQQPAPSPSPLQFNHEAKASLRSAPPILFPLVTEAGGSLDDCTDTEVLGLLLFAQDCCREEGRLCCSPACRAVAGLGPEVAGSKRGIEESSKCDQSQEQTQRDDHCRQVKREECC